ncbi:MAG: hypothetical protein RL514_2830 [Verrucomicrobiota bacterium]|jgi:Fic family protein
MQLNELLAQVDALKKEIDQLRPLKPEVEHRVMQKFRLDWNYHSNAIEGNSLTLGETHALLKDGIAANKRDRDHTDIKGHDELLELLPEFIRNNERLNETAIKRMHEILLREPYDVDAITENGRVTKKRVKLGAYKVEPNCVRTATGEIHRYATPDDVVPKMHELVEWHRKLETTCELHPVQHAALLHHKFLAIHPFDDGNGRLARVLMNLVLLRHDFPPVVVKKSQKDSYVAALRRADVGEYVGLVEFVAQGLLDSETLYLRGARGDSVEDYDDVDKAVALLKQELQAVPIPLEYSLDVQRQHFEKHLIPLLTRLDAKLAQFDEFFATHRGDILYDSGGRFLARGTRMDCINWLRDRAEAHALERELSFWFHWEHFLKDGTNVFSFSFEFKTRYENLRMEFYCEKLGIRRYLVYQTWFSEDELKKFVSDFTKAVFDQIQRSLTKNRPK